MTITETTYNLLQKSASLLPQLITPLPQLTVGQRLKDLRYRRGLETGQKLTQEWVAEQVGASKSSVAKWETDAQAPGPDSIVRLAALYDTTPGYIMKGVSGDSGYEGAAPVEETPEQAVAANMPNVSYLLPRARAIYDRAVGSYMTRGWPPPIIERAARELVAYIEGANTLRSKGPGRPELTEEEQVWVLEDGVEEVERAYGPNGVVRRY